MPFLQRPIANKIRKKSDTLQVRISRGLYGCFGKRVFSSASFQNGLILKRRRPASLSVEAALALSLFLFAMVILMLPMKMMNEGRRIQTALDLACERISQLAVLMPDRGEAFNNGKEYNAYKEEETELKHGITKAGVSIYADRMIRRQVPPEKAGGFSFSDSSILEDGETVDLILHYRLILPFPLFRIESIPMTARSCRRAWIGKEGGRGGRGDRDETDTIVYIGKNSTRYHRNRNCHYLYNDLEPASFDTVGALRNTQGKKYKACERCGGGVRPGCTIYVTPSGERYHCDRNCSSIIAYVRAVPLSEVEYLGPCSYCSQ